MSEFSLSEINDRIVKESAFIDPLRQSVGEVIVGQDELINKILIGLLANGHLLLEGVPGLAKTLTVNTLAQAIATGFQRIQFTPDMLPADLLGTLIFNQKTGAFEIRKGPIFSNIILADEINRTPPKTQAALLEAMQEKSVTVSGNTYKLGTPFFVMATQNPIEQEGTYPLPEAQLDRFMFNLILDYPEMNEELEIIKRTTGETSTKLSTAMDSEEILFFQNLIRKIPVADNVMEYAVNLVSKTRPNTKHAHPWANDFLNWGAGPRASQYLVIGAKAHAAISGKFSPDIDDIKAVVHPVLRHRIIRNYKAEAEGVSIDDIITEMI
jgi:MoxR-like ATPase